MLFVVVENIADRDDSWVFFGRSVLCEVALFHVPVEDSTDKGGNKGHSCFGTGYCLSETGKFVRKRMIQNTHEKRRVRLQ